MTKSNNEISFKRDLLIGLSCSFITGLIFFAGDGIGTILKEDYNFKYYSRVTVSIIIISMFGLLYRVKNMKFK